MRALAGEPVVLLLDEVFNGLDITSASILRKLLRQSRGAGSTWIVTTHRASDVPPNVTHVARMEEGRLLFSAPSPLVGEGWGEGFFAEGFPVKEESVAMRDISRIDPSPQLSSAMASPARGEGVGTKRRISTKPLIHLHNVDLYRDYRLVLRDVNWTIHRNEHWAIVGRNGSGKSMLLKLLYGDLHPRLGGEIERADVPFRTPIEFKSLPNAKRTRSCIVIFDLTA